MPRLSAPFSTHQKPDAQGRVIPAEAEGVDEETIRVLLRLTGMVLFPLFVALSARVAFPVPPLGVPFSLQTLAVVLSALVLGPKVGAISMLIYVLAGVIGVPLFAEGDRGWAVILGQTGGYLLGFVACQPVITSIIRRKDRSIRGWGAMITAILAGHAVIFVLGVPWLYVVNNAGDETFTWWTAIYGGMLVFLPAMVVKAAVAVWLGRLAAPWASSRIW